MSHIAVLVDLPDSQTAREMNVPDHMPLSIVLANLVEELSLAKYDGNGSLLYTIEWQGLRLPGDATLQNQGVKTNDRLQIRSESIGAAWRADLSSLRVKEAFAYLPRPAGLASETAQGLGALLLLPLSSGRTAPIPIEAPVGQDATSPTTGPMADRPLSSARTAPISIQVPVGQDATSPMTRRPGKLPLPPRVSIHDRSKALDISYASTIALAHGELLRHEAHFFEDLLHTDYDSLWKAFVYGSTGRYILSGYGAFGGTTLIKCAMEKARRELALQHYDQGAFLGIHFDIRNETAEAFEARAESLTLSHPNLPSALRESKQWAAFQSIESDNEEAFTGGIEIPLTRALSATFFDLADTPLDLEPEYESDYNFFRFISDINACITLGKSQGAIHEIVARFTGGSLWPTRLAVIVDRIQYLETFLKLKQTDLFRNRRILVIVVIRREDFDRWDLSERQLQDAGFKEWYIGFRESGFVRGLFDIEGILEGERKLQYETVCDHLDYCGRGSTGWILDHLRHGQHISYHNGRVSLDIEKLARNTRVRRHAWLQQVLILNWDYLLSGTFSGGEGDPLQDRTRFGIYALLDWVTGEERFSWTQLLRAATTPYSFISRDLKTVVEVVERVLLVLLKNGYLKQDDEDYCVVWSQKSVKKPRRVSTKRTKMGLVRKDRTIIRDQFDNSPPNIIVTLSNSKTPPQKLTPDNEGIPLGSAKMVRRKHLEEQFAVVERDIEVMMQRLNQTTDEVEKVRLQRTVEIRYRELQDIENEFNKFDS